MIARLVLVASRDAGPVQDAMQWARTPVRVCAAATGWVWVLPHGTGPVAMDRVAKEASDVGVTVLVTVTPWRSELQLWHRGSQVRALAWEAGAVSGLDPAESGAAATELVTLLVAPDPGHAALVQHLARQLSGPRHGVSAWRDVVDLLSLPVPAGFEDLPAEELVPGRGRVVHTTSLREAVRAPTAAEEAMESEPRVRSRLRGVAGVVSVIAVWLSVSQVSWVPAVVGAVVVCGCALAIAASGARRAPGRVPRAD